MQQIFTIGHSTRNLEEFLGLLKAHDIQAIADVRRYPASRRHPHFAREALEQSLAASYVEYTWMEGLGGRRSRKPGSPHTAWREPGFAGYADHLNSEEFARSIVELEALAKRLRTAIMCAEAISERCHRRLIADWLTVHGWSVHHITSKTRATQHALPPFARVKGTKLIYDGAD
jgi:uncharacterized protein (DUF488 family)